jgi:hypothetical protein
MVREEVRHSYEFTVIREEDGRTFFMLRHLNNSRIVADARVNYSGKTIKVELDLQSGEMTLVSVT